MKTQENKKALSIEQNTADNIFKYMDYAAHMYIVWSRGLDYLRSKTNLKGSKYRYKISVTDYFKKHRANLKVKEELKFLLISFLEKCNASDIVCSEQINNDFGINCDFDLFIEFNLNEFTTYSNINFSYFSDMEFYEEFGDLPKEPFKDNVNEILEKAFEDTFCPTGESIEIIDNNNIMIIHGPLSLEEIDYNYNHLGQPLPHELVFSDVELGCTNITRKNFAYTEGENDCERLLIYLCDLVDKTLENQSFPRPLAYFMRYSKTGVVGRSDLKIKQVKIHQIVWGNDLKIKYPDKLNTLKDIYWAIDELFLGDDNAEYNSEKLLDLWLS